MVADRRSISLLGLAFQVLRLTALHHRYEVRQMIGEHGVGILVALELADLHPFLVEDRRGLGVGQTVPTLAVDDDAASGSAIPRRVRAASQIADFTDQRQRLV